jgi:mono/diheme cytochrome c family protein
MRGFKIVLPSLILVGSFSLALAAGDAGKGKILFSDTKLGGATAGNSCNSCHLDGRGLEKAGDKKDLPKVINACVKNALKGKPFDLKPSEMADLVAYVKSLRAKWSV